MRMYVAMKLTNARINKEKEW